MQAQFLVLVMLAMLVETAWSGDGGLDPGFGDMGRVLLAPGANSEFDGYFAANAAAVQADGRIVIAGEANSGFSEWTDESGVSELLVARLLPDGSLDETFGNGGYATGTMSGEVGFDVLLRGDGRILVAGDSQGKLAVWKFLGDGTADHAFGSGGVVVLDSASNGPGTKILAVPDDKLLVTGKRAVGETSHRVIVRLTANGDVDSAYGDAGMATTEIIGYDFWYTGVLVESDGGIILSDAVEGDLLLMRVDASGSLDTSFGNGGVSRMTLSSSGDYVCCMQMTRQDDDKIIVSGHLGDAWFFNTGGGFLYRALPDGTPDHGFGDSGLVLSPPDTLYVVVDSAVQDDGSILAVGAEFGEFAKSTTEFYDKLGLTVAMRYMPDGQLDTSFGNGGSVGIDFGTGGVGRLNDPRAVAIDSNEDIYIAGVAGTEFFTRKASVAKVATGEAYYPGVVGFVADTRILSEQSNSQYIMIERSGGTSGPAAVQVVAESASATQGSDFEVLSGVIEWASGEDGEKAIEVRIISDGVPEPEEEFFLRLRRLDGDRGLANSLAWIKIRSQSGTAPSTTTRLDNTGTGGLSVFGLVVLLLSIGVRAAGTYSDCCQRR